MIVTKPTAEQIAKDRFADSQVEGESVDVFGLRAVKGGWHVQFGVKSGPIMGAKTLFIAEDGEIVEYPSSVPPRIAQQKFEERKNEMTANSDEESK